MKNHISQFMTFYLLVGIIGVSFLGLKMADSGSTQAPLERISESVSHRLQTISASADVVARGKQGPQIPIKPGPNRPMPQTDLF